MKTVGRRAPFPGFTVVEMLVVVSVLGVLASLLAIAVLRAKDSSKLGVCVNNLHQLSLAMALYTGDFKDTAPIGLVDVLGTPSVEIWKTYRYMIQPYLGNQTNSTPGDKVFICPRDTFVIGFVSDMPVRLAASHSLAPGFSSYLFNGLNQKTNEILPGIAGVKLHTIRSPQRVIELGEASGFVGFSWHHPAKQELIFNRSRNEFAFVDGHVGAKEVFWNGVKGEAGQAYHYNPPSPFDYSWNGQ